MADLTCSHSVHRNQGHTLESASCNTVLQLIVAVNLQEHLRRHTGETPFHCDDCPMKFKTRNTYKRHLRTRHGKELMADGIHMMPHEQFLLIRTKPYLHDDQTTPEDVLQSLLAERNVVAPAEELVIPEDVAQQLREAEFAVQDGMLDTGVDSASVSKVELV